MKKIKGGFTLIELLGTIVVLGIILTIATIYIIGLISSAREASFKQNARIIIGAINNESARNLSFDVTTISVDNIDDLFGVSNENYESVSATVAANIVTIVIIGSNKWDDLVAYGTYDELDVVTRVEYDDLIASVWVYPEESEWSNDDYFVWDTSSGDGAVITGFEPTGTGGTLAQNFNPVIPETYMGLPVIGIGTSPKWEEYNDASAGFIEKAFDYLSGIFFDKVYAIMGGGGTPSGPFGSDSLVTVKIPNTVKFIGSGAFDGNCIDSIILPPSLEVIDSEAFANNCIVKVEISENVKYIGDSAFSDNYINELIIPSSVERIGSYAFENNEVSSISRSVLSSVDSWGDGVFKSNNITEVVIPGELDNIPYEMFMENQLTEVTLESGVSRISESAFYYNYIDSLSIASSVVNIGLGAFAYNNLVNVTIPEGTKTISFNSQGPSTGSFYGNQLESVSLPSTITYIGYGTFAGNPNLHTIVSAAPKVSTSNCALLLTYDIGWTPWGCDTEVWANDSNMYIPYLEQPLDSGYDGTNNNLRDVYNGVGTYTSTDPEGVWTKIN